MGRAVTALPVLTSRKASDPVICRLAMDVPQAAWFGADLLGARATHLGFLSAGVSRSIRRLAPTANARKPVQEHVVPVTHCDSGSLVEVRATQPANPSTGPVPDHKQAKGASFPGADDVGHQPPLNPFTPTPSHRRRCNREMVFFTWFWDYDHFNTGF